MDLFPLHKPLETTIRILKYTSHHWGGKRTQAHTRPPSSPASSLSTINTKDKLCNTDDKMLLTDGWSLNTVSTTVVQSPLTLQTTTETENQTNWNFCSIQCPLIQKRKRKKEKNFFFENECLFRSTKLKIKPSQTVTLRSDRREYG